MCCVRVGCPSTRDAMPKNAVNILFEFDKDRFIPMKLKEIEKSCKGWNINLCCVIVKPVVGLS